MTAISGRKYLPLLKQNSLAGAFSRMFLDTSVWASTKCYLTWKAKVTTSNRLLFQLAPSMPRTDETGFGSLLHTPTASSGEPPKNTENWTWTGLYWVNDKGQKKQTRLKDQVRMWPTPTARDYKDNGQSPAELARNSVTLATHAGGTLNPAWVEHYLMGYPRGWTNLETSQE
jgi:hypothetical protein